MSLFFDKTSKCISAGRIFPAVSVLCLLLASCTRYEPAALEPGYDEAASGESVSIDLDIEESTVSGEASDSAEAGDMIAMEEDSRIPVRVKGVYLASNPLANETFVDNIIDYADKTELNAVVIDIKDDYGRLTYDISGSEIIDELGSVQADIEDMPEVMAQFKMHGIYTIARIVSMRDPYISGVRPEWCLKNPDGTLYEDASGYTWVNPYKTEYWDYLLEIAKKCAEDGFDEIQFDYIRFCTDKGADDCVYDDDEVKGRDKISIITEAVDYLCGNLKGLGVFVSCDVFGTIIRSQIDSRAVGQDYVLLASIVDYMSPMIYPSHYSSGNFGLDSPDMYPYESISGALFRSKTALAQYDVEGQRIAAVRPWLQAFTASWLGSGNYISYDADAIRKEIQAVYDAGYDEWILWNAAAGYDYSLFLTSEEEAEEDKRIEESRAAALLEAPEAAEEELPAELRDALDGDDLYEEDREILEQDGPVITYE